MKKTILRKKVKSKEIYLFPSNLVYLSSIIYIENKVEEDRYKAPNNKENKNIIQPAGSNYE